MLFLLLALLINSDCIWLPINNMCFYSANNSGIYIYMTLEGSQNISDWVRTPLKSGIFQGFFFHENKNHLQSLHIELLAHKCACGNVCIIWCCCLDSEIPGGVTNVAACWSWWNPMSCELSIESWQLRRVVFRPKPIKATFLPSHMLWTVLICYNDMYIILYICYCPHQDLALVNI